MTMSATTVSEDTLGKLQHQMAEMQDKLARVQHNQVVWYRVQCPHAFSPFTPSRAKQRKGKKERERERERERQRMQALKSESTGSSSPRLQDWTDAGGDEVEVLCTDSCRESDEQGDLQAQVKDLHQIVARAKHEAETARQDSQESNRRAERAEQQCSQATEALRAAQQRAHEWEEQVKSLEQQLRDKDQQFTKLAEECAQEREEQVKSWEQQLSVKDQQFATLADEFAAHQQCAHNMCVVWQQLEEQHGLFVNATREVCPWTCSDVEPHTEPVMRQMLQQTCEQHAAELVEVSRKFVESEIRAKEADRRARLVLGTMLDEQVTKTNKQSRRADIAEQRAGLATDQLHTLRQQISEAVRRAERAEQRADFAEQQFLELQTQIWSATGWCPPGLQRTFT